MVYGRWQPSWKKPSSITDWFCAQSRANLSVKPQMVNFLDFSGDQVHVTTTLFCPCNTRVHGQAHEWAGLGSSESWWHLNVNFVKLSHYKMLLLLLQSRFSRVRLLCDPIDGSPPGSSIPGTLQARILEWVAISFSNAWKWKVKVKSLSRVWLLVTPWTAAYQAPPSMGSSRQEYWSGLSFPSYKMLLSLDFSPQPIRHVKTGLSSWAE